MAARRVLAAACDMSADARVLQAASIALIITFTCSRLTMPRVWPRARQDRVAENVRDLSRAVRAIPLATGHRCIGSLRICLILPSARRAQATIGSRSSIAIIRSPLDCSGPSSQSSLVSEHALITREFPGRSRVRWGRECGEANGQGDCLAAQPRRLRGRRNA